MLSAFSSTNNAKGFTLIEAMVAMAVLAILIGIGAPYLADWVRNNKVRLVASALQNGVRTAQASALSRSQSVVLFLSDAKPAGTSFTAKANGKYWAAMSLPGVMAGESAELLDTGVLNDSADGVSITGPAAICFNSLGRLAAHASPGLGTTQCHLPSGGAETFVISIANGKRRLQVMVSTGGQVRFCDPDKDMSQHVDGCPT